MDGVTTLRRSSRERELHSPLSSVVRSNYSDAVAALGGFCLEWPSACGLAQFLVTRRAVCLQSSLHQVGGYRDR